LITFFVFFIFLHLYGIYGHMINDYYDREADRQIGKTNILGEMSEKKALGLVVLIFVAGIITSLAFFKSPFFITICVLSYFMATFYSMPPIRFKERGPLGVLVPAIAQQTLPVLLIFSAFDYIRDFGVFVFSIYVTIIGFRKISGHLLKHHNPDLESGLKTYSVIQGIEKVEELYIYSCLIEKFILFFSLIWISIKVHYGFILLILFALGFVLRNTLERDLYFHEFFPSVLIPIFFATLLVIQNLLYVFIFLFIISWQIKRLRNLCLKYTSNIFKRAVS